MTEHPDSISMVTRARQLRRQASPIEDRVWGFLRNGHVDGLKFRRQHPIGLYIVDFYCHAHRLVIEIDGPSHNDQQEYDLNRASWLNQNGYRVIRFTNNDVLNNPNGVRETVRVACRETATLTRAASPRIRGAASSHSPRPESAAKRKGGRVVLPNHNNGCALPEEISAEIKNRHSDSNSDTVLLHRPSQDCSPLPQGEVAPRPKGAGAGEGTRTVRVSTSRQP